MEEGSRRRTALRRVNSVYEEINEDTVRDYVLVRRLDRPKTHWSFPVIIILVGIVCSVLTAFFLYEIVDGPARTLACVLSVLIWCSVVAKPLCIELVRCYQRYANESVRRCCLCMPTCSEYALLVLKRYWLPIALFKIYRRLFHTCRGGKYKIDLPYKIRSKS